MSPLGVCSGLLEEYLVRGQREKFRHDCKAAQMNREARSAYKASCILTTEVALL